MNVLLLNESDDPLLNNKILAEDCPFEVTDDFRLAYHNKERNVAASFLLLPVRTSKIMVNQK